MKRVSKTTVRFLSLLSLFAVVKTHSQKIQTDKNQKDASSFTQKANNDLLSYLPFADKTDYENAKRGFIATIPSGNIKTRKEMWSMI
jgi:alkyl sulfatase BDS1-like metallo-beta-lactamase superfamily hydrolase